MSAVSQIAARNRENARRGDGRFGHWSAAENYEVDLASQIFHAAADRATERANAAYAGALAEVEATPTSAAPLVRVPTSHALDNDQVLALLQGRSRAVVLDIEEVYEPERFAAACARAAKLDEDQGRAMTLDQVADLTDKIMAADTADPVRQVIANTEPVPMNVSLPATPADRGAAARALGRTPADMSPGERRAIDHLATKGDGGPIEVRWRGPLEQVVLRDGQVSEEAGGRYLAFYRPILQCGPAQVRFPGLVSVRASRVNLDIQDGQDERWGNTAEPTWV